MTETPRTYFIHTFGCQMNVADSLGYARTLEGLGLARAESEESSDLLVVNTCSVREKAEEKAVSYIGRLSGMRAEYRKITGRPALGGIVFVGCMATVRGDEILRRFGDVKVIVPAREIELFEERLIFKWPDLARSKRDIGEFPLLRPEERYERFVPIIRGCINHCTYCIVPAARGDYLESVAPGILFDETASLIESGVLSITFLGQNVNAYGSDIAPKKSAGWENFRDGYGFAEFLSDIRDRFADTGAWFKFLTSHPKDLTPELIDVVASHECFSRHLHLPVQAGDDEVLERMGRVYTSSQYLAKIEMIREKIPDIRLSTDVIVGFPGEDETAFENTLSLFRKVGFDAAFTFLYSTRKGTPAEKWADPVPRDVKKARLQKLIELQNRITFEKAKSKVGELRTVLVEGQSAQSSRRDENSGGIEMVAGRTRDEEVVILPGTKADFGTRVKVKLIGAKLRSFTGERID